MRLIGMLDSPYVRRVAICLEYLGVPFQHEAVSVFSTFEKFQSINPVVKAPTLVCDDGTMLMDSWLILHYVESALAGGHSLWSPDPQRLLHETRAVSLAQAAIDKCVQLVYERNLRPASAQHEPWATRVTGQLLAAYGGLEKEIAARPELYRQERSHAVIATAVYWQLTQSMLAHVVPASEHPMIDALAHRMEQTPQFLKYPPTGPGVPKA